ncbi:ZIP zinc/iron transport family, partial [Aureobasidium sp. EXF-8845]
MSTCEAQNEYDGRIGVRISAIFVIGVTALFATWFPVFAARHRGVGVPEWAFFIAKYFGSGVIIATAFIHLLAPANEALTSDCLTGPITEYDWVEGIVLMTIFVLFFVELMTMRYAKFGHSHGHDDHEPQDDLGIKPEPFTDGKTPSSHDEPDPAYEMDAGRPSTSTAHCPTTPHARGDDHLGHSRDHVDNEMSAGWTEAQKQAAGIITESYAAQMTALFILEFGVIF